MKTYTKNEVFRTAFKYVVPPSNFKGNLPEGINQVCPCCKAGSLDDTGKFVGHVAKIIDPIELRPWLDFYTTFKFSAYKCWTCGYMWSWYRSI